MRSNHRLQTFACLAAIAALWMAGAAAASADDAKKSADFPPELVDFVPYEKNPVFTAAGAGHWDAKIRERGWIMNENGQYRMWYTGYNGARVGWKMLGLATSADGLSWERYPKNPIYDAQWTEDMMILRRDATYYMFAEGFRYGRAYVFGGRPIDEPHLLTSPDGVRWHREGQLEIRDAAGRVKPGIYGTPTAWIENGEWNLFYEIMDRGIWLARARDPRVWTNVDDQPVLVPGPDSYDNRFIALNQIVKHNGRYYGYYHAMGDDEPGRWSTCVASSDDLRHWTKYPGNPLVKNNRSSGILVHDGERYRLYTMHDQVDVYFPRSKQ